MLITTAATLVVNADVYDMAAQFVAVELHDVEMRTLDRFLQTFEAVGLELGNREVIAIPPLE